MESSDKGTREDNLAVLPATCDCEYREGYCSAVSRLLGI